ncbi:Pyridoxine/pyridoxamine 5'-phosphate oxidase [Mycobacterium attenuatum]|uniref:pyridoxamine 5'-phosphate oxidase n=1 Tax=Mycobacterium attenuatum TaxID=2341086 RepID=UPI000F036B80|nr:pyridoxamine 5'-phosphate oxidase [Mycobacterium attenuatum]VBA51143.1 Pyridoxine/pyridoxamine 5'-phosphate oxidase [Mycobacterium attenuatum]
MDDSLDIDLDGDQLARMRGEYGPEKDGCGHLDVDWLDGGWLALLRRWMSDAQRAGVIEPNAMVLATVENGRPVSRTVLCKILDDAGVAFFTSYESEKGAHLAATPYASATFPWYELGRQAHVRGAVNKVSAEETLAYWSVRPRGAQLGAWASRQSRPAISRAQLDEQLVEVTQRFENQDPIPVPPGWGGYRIAPEIVEFWQGRENRLHNRIRITNGRLERLQP